VYQGKYPELVQNKYNKIIRKVTYVKNKSIFHETDIGISFSDKGFGYEEIKA